MEIGTWIIGGLVLAITAIFFLAVNRAKQNRDQEVLMKAMQMAGLAPGKLGAYTKSGNIILGWLTGEEELFYYRSSRKGEKALRIRMQDIREVKVEKEVRSRPSSTGSYSFVQTVNLRLTPSQSGKGDTLLLLYQQDEDAQLVNELEIGQEWASRINDRLKQV